MERYHPHSDAPPAQEHLNAGQTDHAAQDSVAASEKSRFRDYSGDFLQNAEILIQACVAANWHFGSHG
jgi:hypothetical protein